MIEWVLQLAESDSSEENVVVTSFNGLQNDWNFGHIGYVHLDSDTETPDLELSSCNAYDVNKTTCDIARRSAPKSDGDVIVLRAWTATTLRDNILVLLGYLLHQSTSRAFARDIQSSVRLLSHELRRNGVNVMDIVPSIGSLVKANQIAQVFWLLKSLDFAGPPYCRSAINELGKYFTKRRELLKSILSAEAGINLLSDIGVHMIPNLRLNNNANRPFDPRVAETLGTEFAIFFRALQDGVIVLTQPVLAVFMLNMKFDEMTAVETEKFRLLCDVLRLNKVPNWSADLTGTCCKHFQDPHALVVSMLKLIARRIKADGMIQRTINNLVPRLVKVPKTDVAASRMDKFFGNSKFNISLFLDVLEDEAKIPQARSFRSMVKTRSIDLSYGLKGFIRYFYDTPRKLAVAFLSRLRYRVPMSNAKAAILDGLLSYLRNLGANNDEPPSDELEDYSY